MLSPGVSHRGSVRRRRRRSGPRTIFTFKSLGWLLDDFGLETRTSVVSHQIVWDVH